MDKPQRIMGFLIARSQFTKGWNARMRGDKCRGRTGLTVNDLWIEGWSEAGKFALQYRVSLPCGVRHLVPKEGQP